MIIFASKIRRGLSQSCRHVGGITPVSALNDLYLEIRSYCIHYPRECYGVSGLVTQKADYLLCRGGYKLWIKILWLSDARVMM